MQNGSAVLTDAPAAQPAPTPGRAVAEVGPNRRDVQRAALHDLVALATECAATALLGLSARERCARRMASSKAPVS